MMLQPAAVPLFGTSVGPPNGIDAKLCGHGPRAEAVAARRLLAARRASGVRVMSAGVTPATLGLHEALQRRTEAGPHRLQRLVRRAFGCGVLCEYSDHLKIKDHHNWEDVALQRPYFPLLTSDGVLDVEASDVPTSEFWESGEGDLASLLSVASTIAGHDIPLTSSLDFGYGPGRLTLPLARRALNVVGCDISPTMLAHASKNAQEAGLANVTLMTPETLAALPDGQFHFVISLLVLQYIPRSRGYSTIRTLLRLLASDGFAALHLVLAPPGEPLRQLVRITRIWSRLPRRLIADRRRAHSPTRMQTYMYDENVVSREIVRANARVLARIDAPVGDTPGVLLIIEK